MRILGIDSGLVNLGWCLAANAEYVCSGSWKTKSEKTAGPWDWDMARLQEIKTWAGRIEAKHDPDVVVLEFAQFASFSRSPGAAMNAGKVHAAAGVLMGGFRAMVQPVTPSGWKHGLKDRELSLKVRSWIGHPIDNEHEIDACGICLFEIDRNHGFKTTWMGAVV